MLLKLYVILPPEGRCVKSFVNLMDGAMTVDHILLIRHAETDWNIEQRWQGTVSSVPLNDQGRAQAHALANYMTAEPVAALYSSDLARAWETASILGEALRLNPVADRRWREVNVGLFQGHTWAELEVRYPDHVVEYRAKANDYRFPNGESWPEVKERACRAFYDLAAVEAGPMIAVVSHGGVLRSLLNGLFPGAPVVSGLRLPNTSLTRLSRNGHGWELVEAGITPHLPD